MSKTNSKVPEYIYTILDEHYSLNRSDVRTAYINEQDALNHCREAAEIVNDTYEGSNIEPVYYRYEGNKGQEVKDLIGYCVYDKDDNPIESFSAVFTKLK